MFYIWWFNFDHASQNWSQNRQDLVKIWGLQRIVLVSGLTFQHVCSKETQAT